MAYCRYVGKDLPTEAEWHRAAYGDHSEQAYPWGDGPADASRANADFRHWSPQPVGSYPVGASPFGVLDLIGNGWEWTQTPFAPLPSFRPYPSYPGYSADFFDGRHAVVKGGSPLTDGRLLRRPFRNWFYGHYPYAYTTFRGVGR
jgi:formylglycine-generating enzyme required for sulfatase activity